MFGRLQRLTLAAAAALAVSVLPARAAALKDTVPSITVTGHAKTEIVPDIAILSVAVTTERPRATDAAAENARTAQALIDDIKTQGIDPQDIQTVAVTLDPVYDEHSDANGRASKRTLRGYQARNSLAIRVHDIAKASALARRLIDRGANEFEGISYDSDEKNSALAKLRGEAMQDALNKAKAYVAPVGLHLARILEIAPLDVDRERIARYAMDGVASGAPTPTSNIPIEPGTLTLETQVQVVWEVGP